MPNYKYISSENINVYPTALRGGTDYTGVENIYDPESRLSTEANITRALVNYTIDGSFVISSTGSEFFIHGYYFKIPNIDEVKNKFSGETEIWANIKVSSLSSTDRYSLVSLVPIEDTTTKTNLDDETLGFIGLGFSTTDMSSDTGVYSLKILENIAGSWTVPIDSLFKNDASKTKVASGLSVSDFLSKNASQKKQVTADEFVGGNFTGDTFIGTFEGNAKTATDASYASHYGTSSSHPQIGADDKLIYVNNSGNIIESNKNVGENNAVTVQFIKLQNGKIVNGMKRTYSKDPPSTTTGYNPGDEWIQYV